MNDYPGTSNSQKMKTSNSKYKQKLNYIKNLIREYVHENAALLDELEEVQVQIIIRREERKFLLKKLCEYEPQTALDVQAHAKKIVSSKDVTTTHSNEPKKIKKNVTYSASSRKKKIQTCRKKIIQPIPVDSCGKPTFPIELGRLTIHSLGDVVFDKPDFHVQDAIYPVGFVSTRIYGSLRDPTVQCVYTCKVSCINDLPQFEISSDDGLLPITGYSPDACHSLLLQKINDALSLNVVSTRPRGNEFFGLSHPIVLNLIQSYPGTRKCTNYKWNRFEISKNSEPHNEDNDAGLSFEYLQRSINFCKYKMAPDILKKPDDFLIAKNLKRNH